MEGNNEDYKHNQFIPRELLNMMELPYGYSILLKGNAGVGKSTLALELLVKAMGKSSMYLSTRVSPAQLFEQFPWVPNSIQDTIVIKDATQAGVTINNPMDEDGQIALTFSGMPELLRLIIRCAENSEDQLYTVIDSWDAIQMLFEHNLKQQYKGGIKPQMSESLNFMYNAFMSLVREHNIKLILVAENVSNMEYLVDAIVELKREFDPSSKKILRHLEIQKSRGIRIANPVYSFTLEDGRFRTFMPWNSDLVNVFSDGPLIIEADKESQEFLTKTIFENQSKTPIATMRVDPTHSELLDILLENIARMQLYNDEIFTMMPPDNMDILTFKGKVIKWLKMNEIDEDRYYKNIRIYLMDKPVRYLENESNVISIPVPQSSVFDNDNILELLELLSKNLESIQKENQGNRAVNYGDLNSFFTRIPEEMISSPHMMATLMKNVYSVHDSIFLVSLFKDSPMLPTLKRVSTVFMDTSTTWGAPVINFINPQVPYLFGLLFDKDERNNHVLRLCPIV
ncbi:hypothetical protein GF325_17170 [Candidatus Bathyarchaeota archaeon]|nr:hypothetical protein [Candidatus Bathyarchaeota archaeon]